MKLIKLEEHYHIVDDSEIKIDDYYLSDNIIYVRVTDLNGTNPKRITHSTTWFENVISLNLADIQELLYGYSVIKEVEKHCQVFPEHSSLLAIDAFFVGFKRHEELTKDKLYTLGDLCTTFEAGVSAHKESLSKFPFHQESAVNDMFKMYINGMIPKTEWDITIDENNKITLV